MIFSIDLVEFLLCSEGRLVVEAIEYTSYEGGVSEDLGRRKNIRDEGLESTKRVGKPTFTPEVVMARYVAPGYCAVGDEMD